MNPQLSTNKVPAGICGIFFGAFGIHKFILGYNKEGIIMLCCSVLSCGILYPVMHIFGIIEGIMYLSKSDSEFHQLYVANKKPWF